MEYKVTRYSCTDCKYASARMNCDERIKNNCEGCPMRGEHPHSCRCTQHSLVGEECPDFELAEDDDG